MLNATVAQNVSTPKVLKTTNEVISEKNQINYES